MMFFADLFGMEELYNSPGEVNEDNWRLRAPSDYQETYPGQAAKRDALSLPAVLSLALRAKGFSQSHSGLIKRLDELSTNT